MFRVEHVTKSFGGLMAVSDVSFELKKGELSSIIGPNGAGKTTLFNLLTGHIKPDEGRIAFEGKEITDLSPHEICKRGIGRSFQRTNIFPRLSAFDNVQVALISWQRKSRNIFLKSDRLLREETNDILDSIGLGNKKETTAGLLAHGDQRLLEIGITLGTHPMLILLDEPTAGMSPEESNKTVELVRKLVREMGLTLLFIEHDMSVVFGISEKIRVMHMGSVMAEGSPEEIRANDDVQRIYLAEED
ncbi:MAG: ABC transporter ATP-binding protein [Deltaproteobacteria bacterium]|nr:ABC transporter ATP-binding protein [Deltaproteobacteria bacterium]MBW1815924.1 ABC transporter ATP-binding protein [Deltaproteobacteria bacterium]